MKNHHLIKIYSIMAIFILFGISFVSGIPNNTCPSTDSIENYAANITNDNTYLTMEPIPLDTHDNTQTIETIKNIDTPEQFSWKTVDGKDWTTPAKNQGQCGSCWLFSAMGALESVINIKEGYADINPDLSEQYVLSCLPEAGSCGGGNVENCVFYFINSTSEEGNYKNGVITESCFEYQSNYDFIPACSEKNEEWEQYLVPIKAYNEGWTYTNIYELKDTQYFGK